MHEYDVAFKLVLQSASLALRELAGTTVARWLSVELPEVRNTRVDLLGETAAGELVHIELQSSNDPKMALRMAEYCLSILRQFGRFPLQIVLYTGEPPLRMKAELNGPTLRYSYRLVDIRNLDGEKLLESPNIGDNIVAIVTGLRDARAAVHRTLERIARLSPAERETAFEELRILAGLRKLGGVFWEEAKTMPITEDIRDHDLLGLPIIEGQKKTIRHQLVKRFGPLPTWAEERLQQLPWQELDDLSERVLDAPTLEDVFRS
jgi:hypothetical protein